MTAAPLSLAASRRPDGTSVLAVTGEIDMSNAGVLDDALTRTTGSVLVDLSGVEYLDSAGLTVLFTHAERIRLVANPLLEPVLTISGLTELVPVEGVADEE
ncbi:STAS domain-containing protein [Actinomadura sp. ATCC 31491]|uniref:STAS domain-containing protein n=1 Tax=Actinomadura luzonensis TaxID=2805427 RepID=A0ABT0GBX2_9ACTN|nr:STAS domain-containing protein [Actinomadura luzonensis]MCK2221984.1 STAS domain-containing protein [Actinomadura luzonensis]